MRNEAMWIALAVAALLALALVVKGFVEWVA